MNTRLQVEHPVTEMVTGLDLVEWQLRVATGEALPCDRLDLPLRGHAIEARLYAEDPERGFLPQTGTLHRLRLPSAEIARVDTGVRQGDAVTPFYDALIAKIIVWGEDRPAALERLRRALAETAVLGVVTNLGLLTRIAAHPEFAAAAIDTGFIERHRDILLRGHRWAPAPALSAAAVARLLGRALAAKGAAVNSADPNSPWAHIEGWRLSGKGHHEFVFRDGTEERTVIATARGGEWLLRVGEETISGSGERRPDGSLTVALDGIRGRATVLEHGAETGVFLAGDNWRLAEIDPLAAREGDDPGADRLTAPMPGRVTQLLVEAGDTVRRGEPLMIIEAMKMEHTVAAPVDGTVEAVRFTVGDLVEEGSELITLAEPRVGG
jgi:3-methylcrotonyl-CoA carboxylase alpha subunit